MNEKLDTNDTITAGLTMRGGHTEGVEVHGVYRAECYDKDGNLKWVEEFDNLVTTVGKNDLLDKYLGNTGAGVLYMGLKGTGSAAVGDTMASHAGWSEVGLANAPTYSGNRPTPSFSAASGGSKATSSAVSFTFTGSGTVAGCFLNVGGSATKDTTTGILYSAGDFAASRSVVNTDVLNVTYTATA